MSLIPSSINTALTDVLSRSRMPATGTAGAAAAQKGKQPDAAEVRRAVRAAKDFESVLLDRLLKEMKNTIDDGGLLSDGAGDQIKGMFWSFMAQEMGNKGGLGLWKEIYRQTTGHDPAPPRPTVEALR